MPIKEHAARRQRRDGGPSNLLNSTLGWVVHALLPLPLPLQAVKKPLVGVAKGGRARLPWFHAVHSKTALGAAADALGPTLRA